MEAEEAPEEMALRGEATCSRILLSISQKLFSDAKRKSRSPRMSAAKPVTVREQRREHTRKPAMSAEELVRFPTFQILPSDVSRM